VLLCTLTLTAQECGHSVSFSICYSIDVWTKSRFYCINQFVTSELEEHRMRASENKARKRKFEYKKVEVTG
jgi:hypothetical protein